MTTKDKPTCAECVFATIPHGNSLQCFRFPPNVVVNGPSRPFVSPSGWCGEFTPSDPVVNAGPTEWRELNQLDPEAALTLSSLPAEAEFRDLEDGGTWHALHDHLFEIEENLAGNTGDHIKAGLRLRVPLPVLSEAALSLYKTFREEADEDGENASDLIERRDKDSPRFAALLELAAAGLLTSIDVSTHDRPETFLFALPR